MKMQRARENSYTPYIICNDMMYNTWKEIMERVPDFSIMRPIRLPTMEIRLALVDYARNEKQNFKYRN